MRGIARGRWIVGALILLVLCVLVYVWYSMKRERAAREEWHTPRVVQVKGVESFCNYPPTWCALARESRPAGMLARDGDLFWSKNDPVFLYREADGESLVLDAKDEVLLLNGKAVSILLSEGGTGWEWLRKASNEELAGLRVLGIKRKTETLDFPLLEKVARVRRDVGLGIGIDQPDVVARVVSLFEPHFLSIKLEVLSARFDALEPRLAKLEILWSAGEGSLDFLPRLPRLHTLLLSDWVRARSDGIPGGIRTLRSLIIMEAEKRVVVEELSFLRNVTGLQELVLWNLDEIKDITALAALPNLKKVVFSRCKNVRNLSVLERLPQLAWLGFPANTTQETFAKLVASDPGLEVVELDSDEIRDLSPLRSLHHLKAAILLQKNIDVGPLHDLKNLRYLALPKEAFEGDAAEKTVALEQALPDTFVVPAEPLTLCLGSGWILLLVPAVVLFHFLWFRGRSLRFRTDA